MSRYFAPDLFSNQFIVVLANIYHMFISSTSLAKETDSPSPATDIIAIDIIRSFNSLRFDMLTSFPRHISPLHFFHFIRNYYRFNFQQITPVFYSFFHQLSYYLLDYSCLWQSQSHFFEVKSGSNAVISRLQR